MAPSAGLLGKWQYGKIKLRLPGLRALVGPLDGPSKKQLPGGQDGSATHIIHLQPKYWSFCKESRLFFSIKHD